MKATEQLHELGQSLWLDNITRDLLDSGQLQAYIDHVGKRMPRDGGNAHEILAAHAAAGVDVAALGAQLQAEGADAFVQAWNDLTSNIERQRGTLRVSASAGRSS